MRPTRDAGYAMLAAVAAIAAFAYIAFEVMAANRGAIISLSAQLGRARLDDAADAGLVLAMNGVAIDDPARRWPIDGRAQALTFDGMNLTVAVEDERGKAPINRLSQDQLRRLFAVAGASGDRLDTLVAAFQDWKDPDDEARLQGAERADYAGLGIAPRNGDARTLTELARLKGMDPEDLDRLGRLATVHFGLGAFSAGTARPEVIVVMTGGTASPAASSAGEDDADRRGRPMTVRVVVDDGRGGRLQRASVVELTGDPATPYWIRYSE